MSAIAAPRAMTFDPAALLVLKLAAFYWMVLDHMDWLLFDGQGAHASVGRLVFPIFGAVLAYNMANVDSKTLGRMAWRMLGIGAIATPVYAYLIGHWLPINIMGTLAAALLVYVCLVERAWVSAVFWGALLGCFVDYAWFGVFGVAGVALAFRTRSEVVSMVALFAFAAGLTFINGNVWALLAVPMIWIMSAIRPGNAPRMKWLFWVGYPAHLAVLAAIKFAT